jgi:hypothetical protein
MRKLEELFGLDPAPVIGQTDEEQQTIEETQAEIEENKHILAAADIAMDKIDIALPTVTDLDASDKEMDDLAKLAQDTFTDLIDLSMNVEPRFSGPIIQSASTLLGHAITAKIAKMDKKLKIVDLQLKKARLDQQAAEKNPADNAIEGKGMILDRNALLKSIMEQTKKSDK